MMGWIRNLFKEEEFEFSEEELKPPPAVQKEEQQVTVWVKLVDVSVEMKQGYRQVPVFITEPPPVTFDYCFEFIGWWLLAAVCWAAILFVPFFIIMMILAALGVVR
jgi:hypothetical protein